MSGTFGSDHHHHYRGDTRYLDSMVTTKTHPAKTNANLQDSESDPYNYFQTRDQSSNVKELAEIREVKQTNKDFMDLQMRAKIQSLAHHQRAKAIAVMKNEKQLDDVRQGLM